ncbi:MAG: Nucleoside-diphosphate-sugar epimerase-like protein [Frankiales bacterium]|nr:Nucleoside-diphosphate-sugar epimerase-like protein [Frankiales bacterium]
MRRRGRRTTAGQVVAVTGAADGLGRAVLERLAVRTDLGGLIGIAPSPVRIAGVDWRPCDVRDPVLAERLAGVDTVVHLATTYDVHLDREERRALNVHGTAAVLDAARSARVRRVVLVTSAEVYGAVVGNPVPLAASASVQAQPGEDLLGDHVEVERLASLATDLDLAVIRPAALVGGALGASYDGTLLLQLNAPRLLAARGTEPLWQVCHVDDLVRAVEVAVAAELTGPLPVACDGWLAQSSVEQLAGKRRVQLPAAVALSTAERLHRLGVSSSSPRELDHLLAPVIVASERLRVAGWSPQWTNDAALRAHVADRARSSGRTSAYTAAGATVAVLGTAALVRQARRRRRGL